MADVSEKMVGKTPRELLSAGARAYATGNYSAAVQYLSRASELTVVAEGSPTHDSLGEIYFLYGKSLLELSREEGDPLGDVVPKDIAVIEEAEEEGEEDQVMGEEDSSEDGDSEEDGEGEEEEEEDDKDGEEEEDDDETEKDKESKEEQKVAGATAVNGVEFNGEIEKSEATQNLENDEKSKVTENEKCEDGEKAEENSANESSTKAGTSDEKSADAEEETASDLQVAWEVLELAKIIFTKRGEEAKTDLAETLITLGEVSLESENFESAVNDIREGLEIQKVLYDDTDRALAETHYKLGMALSTNNKIEEATENFNRSIQLLKNRIEKLKDSQKSIEKKEVEDMKQLIPEIEEKIVDLKNYNEEVAKKATEETRPILPGSPEKKAKDISHLVKRKRSSLEDDQNTASPAKKPALNL